MPKDEVAGEGDAGGKEEKLRTLERSPEEDPQHRDCEGDAPEGGRGRAGLGEADEDRGERDADRAEEQRGKGGPQAR